MNGAMLSEETLSLNNRLRDLTVKYNTTVGRVRQPARQSTRCCRLERKSGGVGKLHNISQELFDWSDRLFWAATKNVFRRRALKRRQKRIKNRHDVLLQRAATLLLKSQGVCCFFVVANESFVDSSTSCLLVMVVEVMMVVVMVVVMMVVVVVVSSAVHSCGIATGKGDDADMSSSSSSSSSGSYIGGAASRLSSKCPRHRQHRHRKNALRAVFRREAFCARTGGGKEVFGGEGSQLCEKLL